MRKAIDLIRSHTELLQVRMFMEVGHHVKQHEVRAYLLNSTIFVQRLVHEYGTNTMNQ